MEVFAQAVDTTVIAQGILVGFGGLGPAIAVGLMGAAFMNAVSRNPESARFLGRLFIFVGIAELFGLLAFAAFFIV